MVVPDPLPESPAAAESVVPLPEVAAGAAVAVPSGDALAAPAEVVPAAPVDWPLPAVAVVEPPAVAAVVVDDWLLAATPGVVIGDPATSDACPGAEGDLTRLVASFVVVETTLETFVTALPAIAFSGAPADEAAVRADAGAGESTRVGGGAGEATTGGLPAPDVAATTGPAAGAGAAFT